MCPFLFFFFKFSDLIWYNNPPLKYPLDLTGNSAGVKRMRAASRVVQKVYQS